MVQLRFELSELAAEGFRSGDDGLADNLPQRLGINLAQLILDFLSRRIRPLLQSIDHLCLSTRQKLQVCFPSIQNGGLWLRLEARFLQLLFVRYLGDVGHLLVQGTLTDRVLAFPDILKACRELLRFGLVLFGQVILVNECTGTDELEISLSNRFVENYCLSRR